MNGGYKKGEYVWIKFNLNRPFVNAENAVAYLAFKGILEKIRDHIPEKNKHELEEFVASLYCEVMELRQTYEAKEQAKKDAGHFHLCADCQVEIDLRKGKEGVDYHKGKDDLYHHAICPTLKPDSERNIDGDPHE